MNNQTSLLKIGLIFKCQEFKSQKSFRFDTNKIIDTQYVQIDFFKEIYSG